ncbi:60S ribosomal protein L18 [Anopheles sinensis]|uniref:60S ribosomal protein L18 n=1 Tax=Anopheles sinensis TaxID=74873 RepID=A0A084WQS6_ANOSI|nr:60S ribosomal protein L18 [Anopheles sinensis]
MVQFLANDTADREEDNRVGRVGPTSCRSAGVSESFRAFIEQAARCVQTLCACCCRLPDGRAGILLRRPFLFVVVVLVRKKTDRFDVCSRIRVPKGAPSECSLTYAVG